MHGCMDAWLHVRVDLWMLYVCTDIRRYGCMDIHHWLLVIIISVLICNSDNSNIPDPHS